MDTTYYLNNQPVQIIARENSREVWVETIDGDLLRVFKAGLATSLPADAPRIKNSSLRVEDTRAFAPAI